MRTPLKENLRWKQPTWHMFYNRANNLCFVIKKQHHLQHEPFYAGSCFHFYNQLSSHHSAVLQYADKLPMFVKKTSQKKQGRKKRRKTRLDCINKCHLCKMVEPQAYLTSISILNEPLPRLLATTAHCLPITQPDGLPGLAWSLRVELSQVKWKVYN
jgi:hypothetical protein